MPGRGNRKVAQGGLQRIAVGACQRAAAGLCLDGNEHPQEMFDAAVAVAQQAERLVEAVVWSLTDLKSHILNSSSFHAGDRCASAKTAHDPIGDPDAMSPEP
jgi:hypothetical protein